MRYKIFDSVLKLIGITTIIVGLLVGIYSIQETDVKIDKQRLKENLTQQQLFTQNIKLMQLDRQIKEVKEKTNYTQNYLDKYFIPLYNNNLEITGGQLEALYNMNNSLMTLVTELTKKPSYDYLRSVTVYMYVEKKGRRKKDNRSWMGTGIVIKITEDYTYLLTNKHVIGYKKDNTIKLFVNSSKQNRKAEIVEIHKNLDLAIIKIHGKLVGKQAVKGYSIAKPQDRVFMVGNYLGIPYIYSEGAFAGYINYFDSSLMDLSGAPGNSGSGVFDKDGNLVAVLYACLFVKGNQIDTSKTMCVKGLQVQEFVAFVFGNEEVKK